jgi:hypothetical protein
MQNDNWMGKGCAAFAVALGLFFLSSLGVQISWNHLAPSFDLPLLTYSQGMCLTWLLAAIGGNGVNRKLD